MDLEVVGRHALFFDDDAMAAFVNSPEALVDWNSLFIDRYDVRHLLTSPPPPRSRRRLRQSSPNPEDSIESELDHERYLDLPSPSEEQDIENETEQENAGRYTAVPFSYGEPGESIEQKNIVAEPGFQPPFKVPEHLLQHVPPTEKVHQIIARTALFVRKHGGQSEIVLRVKQGDNPTFGFLMPDHDLHPYFRFLVDHQELLNIDGKSMEEENKSETGTGGALSLLGSVYGSGEDEDAETENSPTFAKTVSEEAAKADNIADVHKSEQTCSHANVAGQDEEVSKHPASSLKERAHVIKRNRSISTVKGELSTVGLHKEGDSSGLVSSAVNKLQTFTLPSTSNDERPILEPPSDMKRVVEKIVEFILRNGKEFEAVLVQQDTKHGRFPFLLASNQYYPYYLKVLQKAQESKLAGKGIISEKHVSLGQEMDMKTSSKDSSRSLASDIPYETDRKERFKMVIGKSKKDGQDQVSKVNPPEVGVSVDAAAAAAILQAATKGIKYPNLSLLSRASLNGISQSSKSEGREPGSGLLSSQSQSSIQKMDHNGEPGVSVSVAKDIAKKATIAAAGEADSAEATLTRDQKIKSERLKRAKMFAAMIKSGAAPLKSEPLRGLSLEPPESGFSGPGTEVSDIVDIGREEGTVPLDIDTHDKTDKCDKERRSKRKYRSRFNRDGDETVEKEEEGAAEDSDHKHSRKKRRSHHSSRHGRSKHKHSRRHSSSKDRGSRHHHKDYNVSEDEQHSRELKNRDSSCDDEHMQPTDRQNLESSSDDEHRRSRRNHKHDRPVEHGQSRRAHRHDSSSDDERRKYSRHRHNHDSSSEDDHLKLSPRRHKHDRSSDDDGRRQSRHRRRHAYSSDDEHSHQIKSAKHKRTSRSEREGELEEGEILAKSDQSKASEGGDGASREASVDISKSFHRDLRASSQPSETTEVSDDLRSKIRAMLMATL